MEPLKKDLIIVGGGLSGLSAAITAAASELDVLVIEKNENPGSRDPIDELTYPHTLKKVLSDYASRNDLFTPLEKRAFWITTPVGHFALECVKSPPEKGDSGFVADRPALDFALAERLRNFGGDILTGVEATSFVRNEKGNIAGVVIGRTGAEYHAPLTIIAEGASSPLTDHLLERRTLLESETLFVAKEIFSGGDPSPSIKFTGNESATSILLLGDPLDVGFSWARIIAWKNHLILKIYIPLDLMKPDIGIKPMLESLKMHPSVEPHIHGLQKEGFVTSIVPIGDFEPHADLLWGDGYMITGKAARLYHPFDCRMTDYSIESGVIAGRAAIAANLSNQPSYPPSYPGLLKDSFLIPDRNSMSNVMNIIRTRKAFASSYPDVFLKLIEGIFTMDERPKKIKKKDIDRMIRQIASPWDLSKDLLDLLKNYG